MMREYKRYNQYKDSGIEWIDEIPKHWGILKNKYIFRYRKNKKNRDEKTPVLSLTTDGVKVKNNLSFGKSTESYIGHQLVYPGELVFTPRDFDQTPILSGVSKNYGCISNLYIVLDSNKRAINEYINYYWWGLKYGYDYFKNFSTGLRYSFNRFEFDNIPFVCPSIQEQETILSFLDQKTAEIDEIINKKEKLIDHLKKYKKSIITEAVTKGKLGDKYINEDGELVDEIEMKDSGIEWIGEIPEYWEVSKIKYVSNINQKTLNENIDSNKIIKYIDIGSVNSNGQIEEIQKMKFKDSPSRARRIISDGDTIVSTVRTYLKAITSFDKVGNNLICSTGFAVLSPNNKILSDYLAFLMRSSLYIDEIVRNSFGVSYPAINSSILGSLDCILPDINTQKKITNFINFKINKIDNLVNKTKKSIEKYKKYKKSLIFEAVTGKIDLRDYELEGGEELAEHNNSRETERERLSAVD